MGGYGEFIVVFVFMGVWTALCVWATLQVVAWTLIRSTLTGELTRPVDPQGQVEREAITPEFYVAQGFADMPSGSLVLENDEDVSLRLQREGLWGVK